MIVKAEKHFDKWSVLLKQDHQSFHLDLGPLPRTKKEAEWFANQFKIALYRHNYRLKNGK